MNARRIAGMIFHPEAEWASIAREPPAVGVLLLRYVIPLCLIPSIATTIGMTYFSIGWNPLHGYALQGDRALATGIANFAFLVLSILILAAIFHVLAKGERGARSTYASALQVATYGAVPVLLSGVFLVIPVMVMLTLVACLHSLYLYNGGLRTVLGVGTSESTIMLGISIVGLCISSMAIGGIASALGLI
ncbi:MAG: YIP1 family protein [Prolixibacteraceae bacterium]|nr:YIP1 family protein [Burkholderiales bacterium]